MPHRYNEIKNVLVTGEHPKIDIYLSDKLKHEFANVPQGNTYTKSKNVKQLVVYNLGGELGAVFTAKRVQNAAKNIGWDIVILNIKHAHGRRRFNRDAITFMQPDFVISHHVVGTVQGIPHYLMLHYPNAQKFENMERFFPEYNGLLTSFKAELNEFEVEGRVLDSEPFYLSVSRDNGAFEPIAFKKIFFSGTLWDERRGGADFKYMLKKLDEDGIAKFYGPPKLWEGYNSYEGFLPYNVEEFLGAMKQAGIALVAHGVDHYNYSVPSSRVFEAAAASNIIISDGIQFVRDHFGDSVLYYDPTVSGEELYKQIKAHYNWIQEHPEEAAAMAKRSNEIFNEKFTLEQQLLGVEQMYLRQQNENSK